MCDAQATTRNEIMVTGLGLRADTAKKCAASGIPEIFQAQLGYLTLVLVQKADDKPIDLTTKQIYLALADQVPQNEMFVANKAKLWSDVDEALPAEPIHIIAAPRPGATRRLLEGEAMMAGCRQFPNIQIIFDAEPRTKICTTIRADVITEIDSNPDRVAALKDAAPGTIALTTVDEYRKNQSWLRIVAVDGFLPDRASVNAEDYTLAIPIYAYTNKNNLTASGDLRKWLEEALSEEASGPEGYLEKLGLTILPAATRDWQRRFIQD